MTRAEYERLVAVCLDAIDRHRSRWPAFAADGTLAVEPEALRESLSRLGERLDETYPFFHPLYAGQMLKPPHPVATLAYLTAMHLNPNNHALDGGPATTELELEVIAELARMVGWREHLGHLTGGGTVANLEALFVARELAPGRAVAASTEAHYTHARTCHLLGVPFATVPADASGRLDVAALEECLETRNVGTVVATLGATGTGAPAPLDDIVALCQRRGARVHVDAAYGGFFALIAGDDGVPLAPFEALRLADSVVIDPHKHGLQPYGCGSVLFRDPSVAKLFAHDSPYTYYTSEALHLGEIALECSRAGAAAAALWLTLECLPLERTRGLGPVLARCRSAARRMARAIDAHEAFTLIEPPSLDIVVYAATRGATSIRGVSEASENVFTACMEDEPPIYLSKVRLPAARVTARLPGLTIDADECVLLRSCLMKPEHDDWVETLVARMARHVH